MKLAKRKGHCVGRLVVLSILAVGWITGMAVGLPAQAETQYIPTVSLAQSYDTNVFLTSKQFIPKGSQSWDLITTLAASVDVLNKSRLGDSSVRVGVDGNAYAYNTDLTYASTGVVANSDVTEWAQELLPGLKLQISDTFQYSPQQPTFSFLRGTQPSGTPQASDAFTTGLQGARADSYSNVFSTNGEYAFSRLVSLRTQYTYSIRHTGRQYVPADTTNPALNFFNTQLHRVTTGPTFTLDGGDTLFMRYTYLTVEQTNSQGAFATVHFTSQSIQPEYETRIAQDWTARISAGATLVESNGNTVFTSGSFSLANDFDQKTRVSIEVSRQANPLYISVGGAMITNLAQLYVSHDLSRVLRLTVRGGYADSVSTPHKVFKSITYNGTVALDYYLTRSTFLSLSQQYSRYDINAIPNFDRFVTMLSVRTEW